MGGLVWDDELEKVAASYVDKCLFEHSDNYRKGSVGENLYIGFSDIVSGSVKSWADES